MEISNLLRKEMCNFVERKCSKLEYWKQTLKYIQSVEFLTNYGKENLEPVKAQNIKKVEKRIKKRCDDKQRHVFNNMKMTHNIYSSIRK